MFRPIGVFDSGVGGLCVLSAMARMMPNEKFIYIADEANMPYGTRTPQEIRRAALCVVDTLVGMNCKAIAIACNTATENAIDEVRRLYPNIVSVGLEPAVKPCLRELGRRGYGVALVTEATAASRKFKKLISECGGKIEVAPQKELAAEIDKHTDDIEYLRGTVYAALKDYRDAEAVILGCSHYTFVAPLIRDFYGGRIKIYDGADGAAARLKYCLALSGELAPPSECGSVRFYSTARRKV